MPVDLLMTIAMLCAQSKQPANCQVELILCSEESLGAFSNVSEVKKVLNCILKGATK